MNRSLLAVGLIVGVVLCYACVGAKPKGCTVCESSHEVPREKCCNHCPECRLNFDVQEPVEPKCKDPKNYRYDVQKFPGCAQEQYDTLDAAVEVVPEKPCRKFYDYNYQIERLKDCNVEEYEKLDFDVVEPKVEKKCKQLKLCANVEHPLRDCQCDACHHRRYVIGHARNTSAPQTDNSDRNVIRRSKRSATFKKQPIRPVGVLRNRQRRNRKESPVYTTTQNGFYCRCVPASERNLLYSDPTSAFGEFVSAPKMAGVDEQPVYVGDAAKPVTYAQVKQHMDRLPVDRSNPTANEIIGNLTILYYDIYQQKHKRNLTLPLKYGLRTVASDVDGLRTYDISPIEGKYRPAKINRLASKGVNLMGRIIDKKTGQSGKRARQRT